jgi:hypothetical protein
MTRFRTIAVLADQQTYLLALLSRKIAAVESMQRTLTDYGTYVGAKEAASAKLVELVAILDTAQAKLIEAIAAQATDS